MNKLILIRIIFFLFVISGAYFLYHNQQKPQVPVPITAKAQSSQTTSQTNPPPPVEDLVKQSSRQEAPPKQSAKNAISTEPQKDICVGDQTFTCYEDHYKFLVKNKGVVGAFGDLKGRYDSKGYIKSQCHPITHVIGNAAVEIYSDVGKAYAKGDSFCWSGYYHGVMEGIIGKISRSALASKMDGICDSIPGKAAYSFDYYNCVHGLGRSEEHTSELQSPDHLVCRLLLEKKKT